MTPYWCRRYCGWGSCLDALVAMSNMEKVTCSGAALVVIPNSSWQHGVKWETTGTFIMLAAFLQPPPTTKDKCPSGEKGNANLLCASKYGWGKETTAQGGNFCHPGVKWMGMMGTKASYIDGTCNDQQINHAAHVWKGEGQREDSRRDRKRILLPYNMFWKIFTRWLW